MRQSKLPMSLSGALQLPGELPGELHGQPFIVSAKEAELRERLSFALGDTRVTWPEPTLSPRERHRRRLAFRNERVLYRTTSSLSGSPLVSSFSPDKPYSVATRDEYAEIDNLKFGQPFDFNRPFFEQFAELYARTIKPNVIHDGQMQNSEYTHFCGWSKDCYLMFDAGNCEQCSYGVHVGMCHDVHDSRDCIRSQHCYEVTRVSECYEVLYSSFSSNCHSSAFLTDCIGCKHCLGCANLRNKEYYVLNEFVGKAEFQRIWGQCFNGSHSALESFKARYAAFLSTAPKRCLRNINVEDCEGDLLTNCQNVYDSYNVVGSRNSFHCYDCISTEESLDISMFGRAMSHCYELSGCGGTVGQAEISNCTFSTYVFYGGYEVHYSMSCNQSCQHLFGCADLDAKRYCLLNTQYTKAEYEALLPKVVAHLQRTGEWGQFFPLSLSPYGYNESVACESMPLTEQAARKLDANWSAYLAPESAADQAIDANDLPDTLLDGAQVTTGTVIRCVRTGKPFRLTPLELGFYQRHQLPLPRIHPEERQRLRGARFNPPLLRDATCCVTGRGVKTSYDATQDEFLYSLEAYENLS